VLKISKGFTLLELMIVVAVIGVLAMIAYPSYQTHVMKSRRTEAKTGLLALAQAQEEYRGEHNVYADTLTVLPPPDTNLMKLKGKDGETSVRIEHQFYVFTLTATSLKFTLKATAVNPGPQSNDTQCKEFTLDQTGQKSPPECW
jgi:type IV pilus assembly protein PilE